MGFEPQIREIVEHSGMPTPPQPPGMPNTHTHKQGGEGRGALAPMSSRLFSALIKNIKTQRNKAWFVSAWCACLKLQRRVYYMLTTAAL